MMGWPDMILAVVIVSSVTFLIALVIIINN